MADAAPKLEIETHITVQDCIAVCIYQEIDSPTARKRRLRRLLTFLFFVCALLSIIVPAFLATRYIGLYGNTATYRNLMIPGCFGSIACLVPLILLIASCPRSVQLRQIKASILAAVEAGTLYVGSQKVTLDTDHIRIATDCGESLVDWRGVNRVEKAPFWVSIVLRNGTVVYIPRRSFNSDHDFLSFTSFATEQVNRSPMAG